MLQGIESLMSRRPSIPWYNMAIVVLSTESLLRGGASMAFDLDEGLIQSIQEIGQNYALEQIVLFGSLARGDHKKTSDIDLAVFLLPEVNSRGRMTSDFDDLNTLLKIDIVFINEHINPKLLGNIEREGVSLYERSKHKSQ